MAEFSKELPKTFQEQQRELCKLSEYLKEKETWLKETLNHIGLTQEQIQTQPTMVQCPHNSHHYIPEDSLGKHSQMCPYFSFNMDRETIQLFHDITQYGYNGCTNVGAVLIEPAILKAIGQYIDNKWRESNVSHDYQMTGGEIPLLELDEEAPSEIVQSGDPILLIRYIKSWRQVPRPFCSLTPSLFHPVSLKSWLFQNLPDYHAFKHEVGGEIHIVESILYQFNLTPSVTPNVLLNRLYPLLFAGSQSLILSLWKFLSILKIQQEHNITDNTVQELLPLPVQHEQAPETSLSSQIKVLIDPASSPLSNIPLPVECCSLSTEEKRVLYDFVIEVSQEKLGLSKDYLSDLSLFRDDAKLLAVRAKEKRDEEEKSHLEQLKELRDVKRRRQSYRAKNVHITQKSTKQMFHDIIAARTEELQAAWNVDQPVEQVIEENKREDKKKEEDQLYIDKKRRGKRSRSKERRSSFTDHYERSHKKRKHERSKSRERRSRDSHHDDSVHKRHKHKHKSKHE